MAEPTGVRAHSSRGCCRCASEALIRWAFHRPIGTSSLSWVDEVFDEVSGEGSGEVTIGGPAGTRRRTVEEFDRIPHKRSPKTPRWRPDVGHDERAKQALRRVVARHPHPGNPPCRLGAIRSEARARETHPVSQGGPLRPLRPSRHRRGAPSEPRRRATHLKVVGPDNGLTHERRPAPERSPRGGWRCSAAHPTLCHLPNPLCVKRVIGAVFGRGGSTRWCAGRSVVWGPGVTSPKSWPLGCRAGRAGLGDAPACPPGPLFSGTGGGRRRRGAGRRRC